LASGAFVLDEEEEEEEGRIVCSGIKNDVYDGVSEDDSDNPAFDLACWRCS
jgi:hypothetical protein